MVIEPYQNVQPFNVQELPRKVNDAGIRLKAVKLDVITMISKSSF